MGGNLYRSYIFSGSAMCRAGTEASNEKNKTLDLGISNEMVSRWVCTKQEACLMPNS